MRNPLGSSMTIEFIHMDALLALLKDVRSAVRRLAGQPGFTPLPPS